MEFICCAKVMFNPKTYEYDCTRKCRLRAHGNAITSALTKRSIEDEKLAAYVAKTCCNYADIVDDLVGILNKKKNALILS